jgi:hypothetical protein
VALLIAAGGAAGASAAKPTVVGASLVDRPHSEGYHNSLQLFTRGTHKHSADLFAVARGSDLAGPEQMRRHPHVWTITPRRERMFMRDVRYLLRRDGEVHLKAVIQRPQHLGREVRFVITAYNQRVPAQPVQ